MIRKAFVIIAVLTALLITGCAPAGTSENKANGDSIEAVTEESSGDSADEAIAVDEAAADEESVNEAESDKDTAGNYTINDTGQTLYYNNTREIDEPGEGKAFYGQDAQYSTTAMSFLDNGDGTISDLNTGLMWQQEPLSSKLTWDEAMEGANDFSLAGYDDWRLPAIKELYSLIDFSGQDVSTLMGEDTSSDPFIDTDYFVFEYGDTDAGERIIDSQYASATKYVSTQDGELGFGVNFADGRIKGYGLTDPRGKEKTFFIMYVRGNTDYGKNNFIDNGDGTITDTATGLMWMKEDSGEGMEWEDALGWSEDLDYADYDDWRLPDAKEMQSIVDYTRSPDTTNSAAIDELFETSTITDEGGNINYPFFWTSTTHASTRDGSTAVYIAFGEALGFMPEGPPAQSPAPPSNDANLEDYELMDVHGAGAQRSDPKTGDSSGFPFGHGPQGDVIRIDNYVRCVRSVEVE